MKKYWLLSMLMVVQTATGGELPRPDHIVIVIEENKSFAQIIGNPDAPYINELVKRGALFTNAHGITHPSQPNYLALFSGSTHGITGNTCPLELSGDNLASQLLAKGLSFASYSEFLPETGSTDCYYNFYRRKHNPVANWNKLTAYNQSFIAFPSDYAKLPAVALVIPDQSNDMHDGSIVRGDAWLKENIEPYAQWAMTHNSLLIVTWDEDNGSKDNRVATIMVGQMVKPGKYEQRIDHYSLLRTLEEMYGLSLLNESASRQTIKGTWLK